MKHLRHFVLVLKGTLTHSRYRILNSERCIIIDKLYYFNNRFPASQDKTVSDGNADCFILTSWASFHLTVLASKLRVAFFEMLLCDINKFLPLSIVVSKTTPLHSSARL